MLLHRVIWPIGRGNRLLLEILLFSTRSQKQHNTPLFLTRFAQHICYFSFVSLLSSYDSRYDRYDDRTNEKWSWPESEFNGKEEFCPLHSSRACIVSEPVCMHVCLSEIKMQQFHEWYKGNHSRCGKGWKKENN